MKQEDKTEIKLEENSSFEESHVEHEDVKEDVNLAVNEPEIEENVDAISEEAHTVEQEEAEKPEILEKVIEIYTDGACSGNPGPGGYGAIIINGEEVAEIKGGQKLTTNNKMELMGAIYGLQSVKDVEARVKVYTDSIYVQKGITEWIINWKKKNFKDVKNVELWKELDELSSKLNIEWHWVKAHAGNKYNEMADALAKSAVEENR